MQAKRSTTPGRVAQVRQGVENGFAVAQTNTGHYASKEPSASFVLSNPQKALDYAYRAVHVTAVTAKEVANRYYAQPVAKAYWNSCSNGGRQGLLEAQRYPEDFDGIVANAPWVDQTGFTIGALWNQRAFAETHVSADKLALVADRAMQQCDAVDGLRDGLIDDPRQCKFNVARDVPSCAAGNEASAMCLTAAEAAAVQKVYDGPQSRGRTIFPGFMVGSEAVLPRPNGPATSGWMGLIAPAQPGGGAADFGLAEGTMRYLVFQPPQAEWDFRTFDFDRHPPLARALGRARERDGHGSARLPRARRQGADHVRLGRRDPAAADGRRLLRESRQSERPQRHGLHATVHDPRHGALRRRSGARSVRCRDRRHRLGREGQCAGFADREQDRRTAP